MPIADRGANKFASMPQSARAPRDTFGLLADFFECKGDQALTQNEVAVCLEWLQQVTQPAIFSTPATIRKSARLVATSATPIKQLSPQQPDMTPVKRQIKELLASAAGTPAKSNLTDKVMPIDDGVISESAPAPTCSPATGSIIITRTAKTILDVLSSGGGELSARDNRTPEKAKPVVALPDLSPQVAMAISGDATTCSNDDHMHHHPLIGDNAVTLYGSSHSIGERAAKEKGMGTRSDHLRPIIAGSTVSAVPQSTTRTITTMTSGSSTFPSETRPRPSADEDSLPTFTFNMETTEEDFSTSLEEPIPASQLPHFHFEI